MALRPANRAYGAQPLRLRRPRRRGRRHHNAASDPRGFVATEPARPNVALLEVPGLQSTPALGKAVFDYQFEIQQAARRCVKAARPAERRPPRPEAKRRSGAIFHSTASPWKCAERSGEEAEATDKIADAAMTPAETMQPERAETAAAAAQHHPENLSRRGAGAAAARRDRRLRIHRAAGGVLVQSLLHLREQGRAGADVGGLVRARGDPSSRARPFRRHAEGGRAASGDAVLSRQPAIAGSGLARREKPQPRPKRKSRARNHGAAYARRRRRLLAGRRDVAGADHHRLDLRGGREDGTPGTSCSTPMRTSPARSA